MGRFEVPDGWNLYQLSELSELDDMPFDEQVQGYGFPAISSIGFDGGPVRDVGNLTASLSAADYPIGAMSVRQVGEAQKDLLSRAMLTQSVLPYYGLTNSQEITKEDFSFGAGFDGPILPVHPRLGSLHGVPVHRDVPSLPIAPDLAVIATPAATVPEIIGQLAERGARAVVILSAGFRERGPDGAERERAVLEAARPRGMRIMGPNCIGFMAPARGVNASFAHLTPRAGDLAFVSQSGAMVAAMLDWAADRSLGFSRVVSLGNMIDVDLGDLLDDLALDRDTRAILLYVEAIAGARKLMSAARAAARKKPVLVIKAGSVSTAPPHAAPPGIVRFSRCTA